MIILCPISRMVRSSVQTFANSLDQISSFLQSNPNDSSLLSHKHLRTSLSLFCLALRCPTALPAASFLPHSETRLDRFNRCSRAFLRNFDDVYTPMTPLQTSEWLPAFLVPFFSLSYPTDTPTDADSFPDSAYYNTGRRDICLMITCIAAMAVLRDALRLGVFEPFARWKLSRDLEFNRKMRLNGIANGKANAVANGNGYPAVHANGDAFQSYHKEVRQMHRSVLRFAEQGWSVVYYIFQWSYGLVCPSYLSSLMLANDATVCTP